MSLIRNFNIRQRLRGVRDAPTGAADTPSVRPDIYRFRAIPVPMPEDLSSVVSSVEALKEVVETLVGQRHEEGIASLGKAVTHNDIYKDGGPKDDAGIDNYVRKVPHLVPSIQPNPHPQYPVAAFGGLVGAASIPTIDLAWTPVTNYPFMAVDAPRFMAVDLIAGTLAVELPGTYVLAINITVEFVESNAGRTTYLRLFDVTGNAQIGGELPIFVGRNQEGLTASQSRLLSINSEVGDNVRLEIGGGDSFTGLANISVSYSVYSIGPFGEE